MTPPAGPEPLTCPHPDCRSTIVHPHGSIDYQPRSLEARPGVETRICPYPSCNIVGEHHHDEVTYGKRADPRHLPDEVHEVQPIPNTEQRTSPPWDIEPGSWARIWAQVARDQATHPEDLRMVVWTHNSEEEVIVRRDHIEQTDVWPETAPQCVHMHPSITDATLMARCTSRKGPGHLHLNGPLQWTDEQSAGFFDIEAP